MAHRGTSETLHSYLRRHYEKVSEQRARRFAQQQQPAPELDLVYDTPSTKLTPG